MRNRSENQHDVCPANRKSLLLAICLTVIPCAVAGSGAERQANERTRDERRGTRDDSSIVHPPSSVVPFAAGWRTVRMKVTAYCPCPKCCGKYSDGVTASGHKIAQGDRFLAADKRHSFGAEMIVPGYNDSQPVEVLDRGGAIRGDRLDVFFNSHGQARQWGVRYLPVKVRARL